MGSITGAGSSGFSDGQVQEGSFVEGKMHGGWVLHDKDGNQDVVTFKNGERVG